MTADEYARKYPMARPSTLQYLRKREQMTERLKREIQAQKAKSQAPLKMPVAKRILALFTGMRRPGGNANG